MTERLEYLAAERKVAGSNSIWAKTGKLSVQPDYLISVVVVSGSGFGIAYHMP